MKSTESMIPPVQPSQVPWMDVGLGCGLFALMGVLCIRFGTTPDHISRIWFPTTMGLISTLRLPRIGRKQLWGGLFLVGFATNFLMVGNLLFALELATWNLIEIGIGTWLIERFVGAHPHPLSIEDGLKALFLSLFVMLPAGSALGGLSVWLHTGGDFGRATLTWWTSNATGIALLLLPCLGAGRRDWAILATPRQFGILAIELAIVLPVTILALEFLATPFIFITIPFAILAVRKGLLHTAILVWSSLAILLILLESHILQAPESSHASTSALWAAATMSGFLPIMIGVIVDQVNAQIRLLKSSESRFRNMLDSASTGFALLDQTGRILKSNPFFQKFVQHDALDLLGTQCAEWIAPPDKHLFSASPHQLTIQPGAEGVALRFQTNWMDENPVWGLAKMSHLADDEGIFLLQIEDISTAMHAEQELRQSQATLQTVIDKFPGVIGLWDLDLKNQFANQAYLDWFGIEPSNVAGMHLKDIVGADTFTASLPFIESTLRGETPVFEREILTPTGIRSSLATYVPDIINDKVVGFYAMITDITPVKKAQQAQLDSLTRLGDIINGASEFSIIATSLDGAIQVFSHGAERMLGYTAAEMLGKPPTILHCAAEIEARSKQILATNGRTAEGFEAFVAAARDGEADSRIWTYVRKDGSQLEVQLVVTPLHNHQGEINGFLGVARDISREQEAIRAIEEAREQAEHASLLKGEFVANMSHEIRTPMNAVLGMVQLLGKTSITPNQRKYLDMIRKSGRSLLGIIDDILDFSKIEAGRMRIEPLDFLLDDVLENLSNIASVNATGKDLEISIIVDPSVPVQLHGDSLRLQQVLLNLIGNALKFTMLGEVSLSIEVLSVDETNTRIGFRIRDTGIGMTDEQQRRLFQPFSQVDSSNTRRFGGTGLGLTISKKLLDMMGGQIGVRSMSQIGTEFFITLPFPNRNISEPDVQSLTIRPLHILALEAHTSSQASLEAASERWGWKMAFVPSLAKGLEILEQSERTEPFDAVLVDGGMASWDDRKSIERIREICQREITIIKMVRTAVENPADEGIRMLDGILVKPITPVSLLRVLKNNLGHQVHEEEESRLHLERLAEERKILQEVRVLLVEDNAFNQVVATETLQALGAGVDLAENGKAAVERLRRHPDNYDLVLMDVQMPVMDGYAATRAIRQELRLTLPVIAMTAGVLPSDRDKCMASGMNDFITKPFEVDQLVKVCRKHLTLSNRLPKIEDTPPTRARRKTVFHPDQLLSNLGDSKDSLRVVRSLVKQFLDTVPGTIRMGRECAGRGDLEEATRAFHNLKSSSATLGAMAFSALAQQIELALQESERRNLFPLIEQLSEEFERVVREADLWLTQTEPRSNPGSPLE